MTENLLFISAQPHDAEFAWQIDVQCWNFRELGILDKYHVLVFYSNEAQLTEWKRLKDKYKEASFFFYEDTGADVLSYIPVLRPHILKKHFKVFEELKDKIIFYLDADVIFREVPDFELFIHDDICWQSDTSSYLDYNYLVSKEKQGKIPENEIISTMCRIGGIDEETLKSYTGKTGGAQYILKGVDSDFWGEVETMCVEIYKAFVHWSKAGSKDSINSRYFENEQSGLQSWCADMWAVNFCLWKRGKVTNIHKELDFTWTTDKAEKWFVNKIFHNAGGARKGMFNKILWKTKSPVGKPISVLKSYANWYYVEAIKKVK